MAVILDGKSGGETGSVRFYYYYYYSPKGKRKTKEQEKACRAGVDFDAMRANNEAKNNSRIKKNVGTFSVSHSKQIQQII